MIVEHERWPSLVLLAWLAGISTVSAQSVCLPAPRLLTTMPMGGQVGTEIEVVITGEAIEDIDQLLFSHPGTSSSAGTSVIP